MSCACNTGMSNTGTGCSPLQSVTDRLILVPYYGSDGNMNEIALDADPDTYDSTFFTDLVNATEREDRWFPIPGLKNVEDVRGENIVEEFNDGSQMFVQEGARSFMGYLIKPTPGFIGKINAGRCIELGAYVIDKEGNLIGEQINTGYLAPIRIDQNSLSCLLIKPTDTTVQKGQLMFNWHVSAQDKRLTMITADEMTYSLSGLRGLLDVSPVYSAIDQTTFTVELRTEYGSAINPVLVEGLLITDFALYNVTDSASVTILTMTESSPGVYVFTFASQTLADELRLTPTKDGYDFTQVVEELITMPLT